MAKLLQKKVVELWKEIENLTLLNQTYQESEKI